MARGWESKHVEEQQAERERAERPAGQAPTADVERMNRRRSLELARARARADLAAASNGAHRRMLEAAIAALEQQLRELS